MNREQGDINISEINDINELYNTYKNVNSNDNQKYEVARKLYRRLKDTGNITEGLRLLQEMRELRPKATFIKREIDINVDKLQLLYNENFRDNNSKKIHMRNTNKIVKVLHVLNASIPYLSNGYCIRSKYIIENQKNLEIEPVVITRPGFPYDFNKDTLPCSNEISREVINKITYYRCLPQIFMRHTPLSKYIEEYAKQICKVVDLEMPDILHAASNYVNGMAALVASRKKNIPFVYEVRGFWEMTTVAKEPLFKDSDEFRLSQKMENYLLNEADLVICISNRLKEEIISRGVRSEKIGLIPNGVDCSYFRPVVFNTNLSEKFSLKGKFIIGYIGSITQYEGLQTLVNVLARLKQNKFHDIRLLIVGDGNYRSSLEILAKNLKIDDYVIFAGKIPHASVVEYYSLFDLCVFPRIDEQVTNLVTPLKPLEAMACAKVVIGSKLDAMKEIIIENINGFIFNNNENDLYNTIRNIYRMKKIGKTRCYVGIKARDWVCKNRDWLKLSEDLKSLYNREWS